MPDESLLYLLRHGETDSNVAGRFAGWSDDPLNEKGRAQCEAAAERLAGEEVRRVFSSPVRRAAETAEILAERLEATVRTVHDLHELEIGPWKGLTRREVEGKFPDAFREWRERPEAMTLDGRERLEGVRDRALRGLNQIGRSLIDEDGEVAAVVTHLAVIRVLWLTAGDRPLSAYHEVRGPHCGLFPLRWRGRDRIEVAGPPPT